MGSVNYRAYLPTKFWSTIGVNRQTIKAISRFFMDFTENIKNIHIGCIIQQKLVEKSMTVTGFAKKIKKERTNVHDIFKRKSIDTELLIEISKALNYDFIRNVYYKEQPPSTILISIKTEDDLLKKISLLEKIIRILKGKK